MDDKKDLFDWVAEDVITLADRLIKRSNAAVLSWDTAVLAAAAIVAARETLQWETIQ